MLGGEGMVKRTTIKKFKKVLAGMLSALMVISCADSMYVSADMTGSKNQPGGVTTDSVKLQEITLELDMTDGLVTGETYLDDMVSVDMNMPYTEEEAIMSNSELTVPGYIQGEEPLEEDEAGALLRFVPDYDGTIQVAGQLEEGQHFQISQVMEVSAVTGSAAKVVFDYENIDKKSDVLFDEFEVKADETYYIGADKGNMRFYQFNYTYEGYVDVGVNLIAEESRLGTTIDLVDKLREESGLTAKGDVPPETYVDGMVVLESKMQWEPKTVENHYSVTTGEAVAKKITYNRVKSGKNKKGAFQFVPKYDGTIQILAQIDVSKIQTSPKKRILKIYSCDVDGTNETVVADYTNTDNTKKDFVFEPIKVEVGKTYYMVGYDVAADGTETAVTTLINQILYTYEKPVNTETVTDDIVDKLREESGLTAKGDVPPETYVDGMVVLESKMQWEPKTVENHYSVTTGEAVAKKITYNRVKSGKNKKGAFQFVPKYDGTIQILAQIDVSKIQTSPKKRILKIYSCDVDGTNETVVADYTNTDNTKKDFVFEPIKVEVGKTYYMVGYDVAADGTETAVTTLINQILYTYEKEITDTQEPVIPAFPGAVGGGKYVSGGRGKPVYTVTNLTDNVNNPQKGSFRWAINQTMNQSDPEDKNSVGGTIVFNVSGNIELADTLNLKNLKNITIAGQTAPGDGITFSGYDFDISNSQNIIIRYVRFRPGAINVHSGGDSLDALWGRDNKGFMIDHCSFSWNTDECLSVYRGEDGTVQWCLVYESLTLSGHSKGRHGYGAIAGGDNVTFHHNLYADHTSRNPRFGGGYAGTADNSRAAVVQFSNNVIYNWGFNTAYGGGQTLTNFVENYNLAGPGTRDSVNDWLINPGEAGKIGGFYINNNYLNGQKIGLLDTVDKINAQGKFGGDATGNTVTKIVSVPYTSKDSIGPNNGKVNQGFDEYISDGSIQDGDNILNDILKQAGATYPRRDAIDARLTAEVANGLGRYVNTEQEVGGYLSAPNEIVESHPAGWDTDGDGIPDDWEKDNGLNPDDPLDGRAVAKNSKTVLGYDGYTNLEVYLSSLVEEDHVAQNPTAEITFPENNAMIQKGTNVTITVDANANVGSIDKAEFYYGTLTTLTKIGEGTINGSTISCKLPELPDGSYFITARVYDTEGNATQTTAHEVHINTSDAELVKEGWTSVSIGDVDVKGYANLENGVLTVKGNDK